MSAEASFSRITAWGAHHSSVALMAIAALVMSNSGVSAQAAVEPPPIPIAKPGEAIVAPIRRIHPSKAAAEARMREKAAAKAITKAAAPRDKPVKAAVPVGRPDKPSGTGGVKSARR